LTDNKKEQKIPKILYVKGTEIPIYKIIDILSWGGDVRTILSEIPKISQTELRASFANLSHFLQKFGTTEVELPDLKEFVKPKSPQVIAEKKASLDEKKEFLGTKLESDFITVFIDACSKGNPGKAGIGIVFLNSDGEIIEQISEHIADTTSNQAEYIALIRALEFAKSKGFAKLSIFSDNELMVNQIKGKYKIKSSDLQGLYEKVKTLFKEFTSIQLSHISRKENKLADKLSYQAIKE